MKKQNGNCALFKIRKHFPQVTIVKDAIKSLIVSVSSKDSQSSRKKDPENCALATACKRQHIADGAIIGIGYSWLIKDNIATRYKTSITVSREITSFDRHQDFNEGNDYMLSKVSESNKLGRKKTGGHTRDSNKSKWPRKVHKTENIRVVD